MKHKYFKFLTASLLVTALIPSMANAGNVKKIYINIAKEGTQATTSDIPANYASLANSINQTVIADITGGNTGIISGNKKIVEGGMEFDGSNVVNIVNSGSNPNLKPSTITMEAWAKMTNMTTWRGIVTNKWGEYDGINLQMGKAEGIASLIGNNNYSDTYVRTSWVPNLNEWYHIAIVHDAKDNSNRLYVNGKLETTKTHPLAYSSTAPTQIGRFYINSLPFQGLIREVRIWNTARTQQEIQDNYKKSLVGNEKGLVGYWRDFN